MTQVTSGNTIKIHYKGTLTDGTVFDSSEGREPLEFKVGSGQVIPGFDKGVLGMTVGQKKQITIPATDAYGERDDSALVPIPTSRLPPEIEPKVGAQLAFATPDGNQFFPTIVELKGDDVILDFNHPLAGKTLIFDIELVSMQ